MTQHMSPGPISRKHKYRFDETCIEITQLLKKKRFAYKAYIDDLSSNSKKDIWKSFCRKFQSKLRHMHDSWLSKKAEEIQEFADKNDMRFYDGIKEIYVPTSSGSSPLLSAEGTTLLTEKDMILGRWAEHFKIVLNRPSNINSEAVDRLPEVPVNKEMDEIPTLNEIERAIHFLSSGKAPGSDSIPAEIYKEDGKPLIDKLLELFNLTWDTYNLHSWSLPSLLSI